MMDKAQGSEQAAADAEASAAACSDVASSNTTSEKCKGDEVGEFRVLWQGIDTLRVTFKGKHYPGVQTQLEKLKILAQSNDEAEQACAQYQVDGEVFAVLDKGGPGYPYILVSPRFNLRLSRYLSRSLPLVSVQIRSSYLAAVGPVEAVRKLRVIASHFGDVEGEETVSRADITLDFTTKQDISYFGKDDWITTAETKVPYFEGGGRFTGWTFGLGSSTGARLYDKKYEIVKKQGSTHFFDLWQQAGWVPWDEAWRLEFELKRATLARFHISTIDQLMDRLPGLWAHLVGKFLRLAVPNPNDNTRSRWANHPLWDNIASVKWAGLQVAVTAKAVLNDAPSDEWLARQAGSLISSMMAREGIDDPKLAAALLVKLVYCTYENKEMIYGATPEDILRTRADLKARKYGTRLNSNKHVKEKWRDEDARAYRESKGRG